MNTFVRSTLLAAAALALGFSAETAHAGMAAFQKATFSGLVGVGADSPGDQGVAKLTLTADGKYTAKVKFGKRSVTRKGAFDSNREVDDKFQIRVLVFTVDVHLKLKLSGDGESITGTIEVDKSGNPINIELARAFYTKNNPTSKEGNYTAILPTYDGFPQGTGWARVKISKTGTVKVAGKLADGANLSTGGTLSKAEKFPVFMVLYNRLGAIGEFVEFDEEDVNFARKELNWIRIANPNPNAKPPKIEPATFQGKVPFICYRYTPPAKDTRVLPEAVTLHLSSEALVEDFYKDCTLSTKNKVTVNEPGADKAKVTLNVKTGLFSGSTFVSLQGLDKPKKVTFKGVILQGEGAVRAEGYFHAGSKAGQARFGNFDK